MQHSRRYCSAQDATCEPRMRLTTPRRCRGVHLTLMHDRNWQCGRWCAHHHELELAERVVAQVVVRVKGDSAGSPKQT
eukprot:3304952-Pleurochrysis_carterae.AAC.1